MLDVPLDVRCMIIGDTKEVFAAHSTAEDINMKLKALNKYRLAMKAKVNQVVPLLVENSGHDSENNNCFPNSWHNRNL